MLTYALWTTGTFAVLAAVFVAVDAVCARWERREKERWSKAFGGSASGARSGGQRDA